MDFFKTAPMRFLLLVTGTWLVIFLLTRTVLLLTHLDEAVKAVSPASASNSTPWVTTACSSMADAVTSTI